MFGRTSARRPIFRKGDGKFSVKLVAFLVIYSIAFVLVLNNLEGGFSQESVGLAFATFALFYLTFYGVRYFWRHRCASSKGGVTPSGWLWLIGVLATWGYLAYHGMYGAEPANSEATMSASIGIALGVIAVLYFWGSEVFYKTKPVKVKTE